MNKKLLYVSLLSGMISLSIPTIVFPQSKSPDLVVLSESNLLVISGGVNEESTGEAQKRARLILSSRFRGNRPLYLFLRTPGGDIQAGLELIDALNGTGVEVKTISQFSASMGFQIVQSLGERLMLPHGVLMSHRAAGGFEGSFGGRRPSQFDNRYDFWLERLLEIDKQVVSRTNGKQTLGSYQEQYSNEMWLTATKAVELGYADRIVNVRCDGSLNGAVSHSANIMGTEVQYDTDKCPLNSLPYNIRVKDNKVTTEKRNELIQAFKLEYLKSINEILPRIR